MNFRNISAWSIRNPVVPIVLFIGLTLAGIVSFMRMDVQQQSGHRVPGRDRHHLASPAPRRPRSRPRSPSRSRPRCARSTASRNISSTANEGILDHRRRVRDRHRRQPRGERGQERDRPDPRRAARRHPRAVDLQGDDARQPDRLSSRSRPSDMTMEQLSWFIDDTIAKRLLSIQGMAEVDRVGRRRSRDPRHPRSRADAGARA